MPVDTAVAGETWARYAWLRDNGHTEHVLKSRKCEDFFAGLQWDPADLALLREARRPALTINKVISTMANVLGEQIYNRTDIAFRPRNNGATSEVADALTKVFMQISDNNQLPWVRSDVFCDGVIGGRGFYDARLDFTDSLRGEVRVMQLNPNNVLIDSDADSYDPDGWSDVIVSKWMHPDHIEMLYSKKDAEYLRGRSSGYIPFDMDTLDRDRDRFGGAYSTPVATADEFQRMARNIRVLDRQWRKLDKAQHFVNVVTGDMVLIPSEWDDEQIGQYLQRNPDVSVTKKLVHRIRWTVVADSVVLHDDWSPYKHFTVVPYFPYFRRGRTIGLVENLLGSQELLNKVSSQELHVVNTSANSGWEVQTGKLQNMSIAELETRGAQTGLVLEVTELGKSVAKIQPNQTPSGLDRISYKAEEHIKSISGVSDYMQGFAREDVAAKSVMANKQSGQANLAKVIDNLNRTDTMLARNILDMVQSYYTEPRLITITKDKLSGQQEQIEINTPTPEGEILNDLTMGEFTVVVTNEPERETFEDSQFDQALRLRMEAGIPIPDRFILSSSKLRDKAQIIQAMEGDQDSPEAQAARELDQRGKTAQVAKLEAEVAEKQANTQKTLSEAPEDPQAQMQLEWEKMEREHALKREQMEREFEMKRQEMAEKSALEREEMERKMQIEAEKAANEAMTQRLVAVEQAKAAVQEQKNAGRTGKAGPGGRSGPGNPSSAPGSTSPGP